MSADTHTHTHQLMSYELVYTSIHSSIILYYQAVEYETRDIANHIIVIHAAIDINGNMFTHNVYVYTYT